MDINKGETCVKVCMPATVGPDGLLARSEAKELKIRKKL